MLSHYQSRFVPSRTVRWIRRVSLALAVVLAYIAVRNLV